MDYDELDAQYALSEYYFSEGEGEGEGELIFDEDALLAEYYGYSSGSDIPLESLFLQSSSDEVSERSVMPSDEESSSVLDSEVEFSQDASSNGYREDEEELVDAKEAPSTKTPEETLSEQLAKITPQILAAISVAAKTMNNNSHRRQSAMSSPLPPSVISIPGRNHSHYEEYIDYTYQTRNQMGDTALRWDEVMDTKKLSSIVSTSPPASSSSAVNNVPLGTTSLEHPLPTRRMVPLDAFRRSRRSSVQIGPSSIHPAQALRQNSINCTLSPSPEEQQLLLTGEWISETCVGDAPPVITVEWSDSEEAGDELEVLFNVDFDVDLAPNQLWTMHTLF